MYFCAIGSVLHTIHITGECAYHAYTSGTVQMVECATSPARTYWTFYNSAILCFASRLTIGEVGNWHLNMPALHVGALNETVLQAVSEVDLNEKCTEQECNLWPKGLF